MLLPFQHQIEWRYIVRDFFFLNGVSCYILEFKYIKKHFFYFKSSNPNPCYAVLPTYPHDLFELLLR